MELSKKDTKMIQGLSVLGMLCLHLFDRLDYEGLFEPLIFLGKLPLSFYLGQLSDFCVMGFAFCSGYAHMLLYEEPDYYKKRLKGLNRLILNYWIILVIFCIVSILAGAGSWMPGDLKTFVGNALLYSTSYNGAWWYLFTYAILILLSPLLLKAVKRWHPVIILGIGLGIYCVAYYIRFYITTDNWILLKAGPLGMTLFEYWGGSIWAKTRMFTRLYQRLVKMRRGLRNCISVVLIAGMLIGHTLIVPSLFVAPVTGIIIICLFHFWHKSLFMERFFEFIGKHSTNIWLTHMFFYLKPFTHLVYIMKYPVLIYAFMFAITLIISMLLQKVERPLMKKLA